MGKKKNRQNSNAIINIDSSESGEPISRDKESKPTCSHLAKCINQNALRKTFRDSSQLSSRQCSECKKQKVSSEIEDIWLCLTCGSCSCGENSNNHALSHFQTPRSGTHYVAIKLETFTVRCYECKDEIPLDCSQKLRNAVELIKQQFEKSVQSPKKNSGVSEHSPPPPPMKNRFTISTASQKGTASNRTKVKGLMNLGNTCFFNSVLQCLAQTPGLSKTLKEMQEGGEPFTLPLKDSEPLTGELDKGGPVSECLLDIINDMTLNANHDNAVLVPRKLLTSLKRRCPQFEGADQHDAHELLRHLLDVVHNEDLRRYQRVILKTSGLSTKVNPTDVAEDKRKRVKELNNKVSEEFMIRPDQVFRGHLVSELQCQDCYNISSRKEGFLDLSLPVAFEKPQPPVVTRRKNNLQQGLYKTEVPQNKHGNNVISGNTSVRCRRTYARKIVSGYKRPTEDHSEPSITEEDKKETNDADVEDNDDMGAEDQKTEVLESGYSSEKPASSRTSPTTECRKNGECDDSACASPSASISECGEQKNNVLSGGLAALTLGSGEQREQNSVAVLLSALSDLSNDLSNDSSNSLKANHGFSSPDLSTESLPDLGLLGPDQDRSCSSEHDDSQSGCKGGDFKNSNKEFCTKEEEQGNSISQTYTGNNTSCQVKECCRKKTFTLDESSEEELMGGDNLRCDNKDFEFNNETFENINAQKDDSRPTSRLEFNTLKARSSPVELLLSTLTLDSNLLNMSLQSYKTECLTEIKDPNSDIDVFSNKPTESSERVKKEEVEVEEKIPIDTVDSNLLDLSVQNCKGNIKDENSEDEFNCLEMEPLLGSFERVKKEDKKAEDARDIPETPVTEDKCYGGEMGFVLVGGVASNRKCPLSVGYSKSLDNSSELPSLETATACVKNVVSDEECTAVNPDMYRKSHITLAPRYQCEEGECSVLSCLNHFTAIEMMAGNNKAGCDMCTQRQNKGKENSKTVYTLSTKRLLICSPPPVLILHLKRFQVQMCSFRKLSCHITFPVVLDLAPFCAASCQNLLRPGQSQILYSLYGVVEHSGTLHGGHYIAYVKVREEEQQPGQPREGTWYYISDSHTSQVSIDKVLNSQAYLLFYERIL